LHRIFPIAAAQHDAQRPKSNDTQQDKFATVNSELARVLELEKELAVARERVSGLEAQKDQMSDTINDLRKRLDSSESRVTAILVDNRPKRGSWWSWKRT
jgi:septal ring factor EnvC (AmiA/AmiB activator)